MLKKTTKSRLATVVCEALRRNFNFWQFFLKFYIQPPVSDFVFLKMYFVLDGLILFRKVWFSFWSMSLGWFLKAEF